MCNAHFRTKLCINFEHNLVIRNGIFLAGENIYSFDGSGLEAYFFDQVFLARFNFDYVDFIFRVFEVVDFLTILRHHHAFGEDQISNDIKNFNVHVVAWIIDKPELE